MTHVMLPAVLAAATALGAGAACAQSAGEFTLGVGLGYVMPKDDNGDVAGAEADVSDSIRPTLTLEYFVMDNLGIEVLAATPFQHDVRLDGLGKVASVQQLPPTVTLQYHFQTGSAWTPLLGVGVNYTTFFDEDGKGALSDAKVRLKDSWGLALHAGVDYALSETGAIRADVRWMDIDSDVEVNGEDVGEAEIDPWIFGVSYIHKF
ncbi:OmpW family protein [Poseidonocella sp. HB161398]|uniref:OmpW/AlkL family protein n=1 Tax=Poseidonocella sp. HB161398 TaxID=2320855 RepID=UPI001108F90A|nr:OmpW family outer membrane protein [Poseidonocella sp. HB161398]